MQACDSDDFDRQVQSLARRVGRWRRGRVGRERMPEDLWAEVLDVATRWGAYRTAHGLGVSYSTLHRRLRALSGAELSLEKADGPEFVEVLNPFLGGAVVGCVLDIEVPNGSRLRLEIREVSPQGLLTVLRGLVA